MVSVEGVGCLAILSALKAPATLDSNGHVKMGAVVVLFAACPGDVFYHTLCLLTWSGHLCAYKTLNSSSTPSQGQCWGIGPAGHGV